MILENISPIMAKGYLYPETITVRNDGGDTWTPSNWYQLGGFGDSNPFANTRQFIADGQTVPPEKSKNVQAPDTIDSYWKITTIKQGGWNISS